MHYVKFHTDNCGSVRNPCSEFEIRLSRNLFSHARRVGAEPVAKDRASEFSTLSGVSSCQLNRPSFNCQ